MKKTFNIIRVIFQVLLILALVGVIVTMVFFPAEKTDIALSESDDTSEPYFESTVDSAKISPETVPTDQNEARADGYYLYTLANENYKNCDACAFAVDCKTDMLITVGTLFKSNMLVNGYRYSLKTADGEYYYTEYSLTKGAIGSLMKTLNMQMENTMYAIRSYSDTSMNYLFSQKSLEPIFNTDETTQKTTIVSNWDKDNLVDSWKTEQEKPVYLKSQSDTYYQTAQTINENTIEDSQITYVESAKGNYYRLVLTLDTDNPETTALSIGNLKAGAGDDAYYTGMVETVEIWENGYYKSFTSVDKWTAKNGLLNSTITFKTTFYYDRDHLDVSSYLDFAGAKEAAKAYDAAK
jgi:hypothetical protein